MNIRSHISYMTRGGTLLLVLASAMMLFLFVGLNPVSAAVDGGTTSNINLLDTNTDGKINRITFDVLNTSGDTWTVDGTPGLTVTMAGNAVTVSTVTIPGSATANPVTVQVDLDTTDTDLVTDTSGVVTNAIEIIYAQAGGGAGCTNCIKDGDEEMNAIATGDSGATDTEVDAAAPVIVSSTPTGGSSGASNTASAVITFSEAMSTGVGTLSDDDSNSYGTNVWSNGNKTVTATHTTWTSNTTIIITLTSFAANAGSPTTVAGGTTITFTTSGGGGTLIIRPDGEISINGGDATTGSRTVNVQLSNPNGEASHVILSESPLFLGSDFVAIQDSFEYTVSDGAGEKTIYAILKSPSGVTSEILSATIFYDPSYTPEQPDQQQPDQQQPDQQQPEEVVMPLPSGINPGDVIKTADSPTLYFVDDDGKKHAFNSFRVFDSWFSDFSKVKVVSVDVFSQVSSGMKMYVQPGTYLITTQATSRVYAVEPGGMLRWIQDETTASLLYGANWAKKIIDIPAGEFNNYKMGTPLDNQQPEGALVRFLGDSQAYYVKNGMKHPVSPQVMVDNEWKLANVVQSNDDGAYLTVGQPLASSPVHERYY